MPEKPLLLSAHPDDEVPLFYAAEWIATRGGTTTAEPDDVVAWKAAARVLRCAIERDRIKITGVKRRDVLSNGERGSAPPEFIEAHKFRYCAVQSPHHITDFDLAFGHRDWLLRFYPCHNEDLGPGRKNAHGLESDSPDVEWFDGFSDALMNRSRSGWAQLTVTAGGVLQNWPVSSFAPIARAAPGRPSQMPFIIAEYEARPALRDQKARIGEVTDALAAWAKVHLGDGAAYSPDAIANALRDWLAAKAESGRLPPYTPEMIADVLRQWRKAKRSAHQK